MDKSPLYLSFAREEVRCITCFLPLIILPASFHFSPFQPFTFIPGEARRRCNKIKYPLSIVQYPIFDREYTLKTLRDSSLKHDQSPSLTSLYISVNHLGIQE